MYQSLLTKPPNYHSLQIEVMPTNMNFMPHHIDFSSIANYIYIRYHNISLIKDCLSIIASFQNNTLRNILLLYILLKCMFASAINNENLHVIPEFSKYIICYQKLNSIYSNVIICFILTTFLTLPF